MGILGSLLLKYYRRGDFSSRKKKGALWRAFLQGSKGTTIFALGFYAHAASARDSEILFEEAKQRLMARSESVWAQVESSSATAESLSAKTESLEQSITAIKKRIEDFERIKKSRNKATRVSLEVMDQKKRSDLVQRMKAEYGLFQN